MTTILRQRITPQRLSSFDAQQQESVSSISPIQQQLHHHNTTTSQKYEMQVAPPPLSSPSSIHPTALNSSYRLNSTSKYPSVLYESPSVMQPHSIFSDDHNNREDIQSWRQRVLLMIGVVCLFAPWLRHAHVRRNVHKLQDELIELQKDQQRLQNRLKTQNDAHTKLTADIAKYQSKNFELFQELRDHGDHYYDFDTEHYAAQSELEDVYMQRIDALEKEIQRMADRQLVSRGYGVAFRRTDAIRVELILKQDVSIHGNKLIIELGPINFLSHAIELFLMLVEHKHYYDNLILMHRSAGSSTISTVPMDSDTLQIVSSNVVQKAHTIIGSDQEKNTPIITNRENTFIMNQLAMLEHTDEYPVQKYSVLFVDKGPHFYIQMDDTIPKKVKEKQETCFGRIVEGQAILDYMLSHHDKNFRGLSMVGIETLKVIPPTTNDRAMDPRFPIPAM